MKKLLFVSAFALALVSVLLLPSAVGAVSTDSTTLSGTVGASITVTAPENITMPSLVAETTVTSEPYTISIKTNTNGWSLEVADTGSDEHDGKMSQADGTDLAHALEIIIDGNNKPLSSSVSLKTGGLSGPASIDIRFRQQVLSNAKPGNYSINLTFTATPGS